MNVADDQVSRRITSTREEREPRERPSAVAIQVNRCLLLRCGYGDQPDPILKQGIGNADLAVMLRNVG